MTKLYCDRCGKESEELHDIVIPTKIIHSLYMEREKVDLCEKCYHEAHARHYAASEAYLEAFANFIKIDDVLNDKKQDKGIPVEVFKHFIAERDRERKESRKEV